MAGSGWPPRRDALDRNPQAAASAAPEVTGEFLTVVARPLGGPAFSVNSPFLDELAPKGMGMLAYPEAPHPSQLRIPSWPRLSASKTGSKSPSPLVRNVPGEEVVFQPSDRPKPSIQKGFGFFS
jgi:hypothetical protein